MSNQKFTPGPWHVDGWDMSAVIHMENPESRWPSYKQIVKCDYGFAVPEKHIEENHANARLISAAPEMYEALKMCQNAIATLAQESEPAKNAFKKLMAALEKAEGKEEPKP